MNHPLPGAIPVPTDDDIEVKDAAVPAAPPVVSPARASQEDEDADEDELWDDSDEDHDGDSDERAQEQAPAEPTVPIRFEEWDPLESTCRHASLSIL